MTAPGFCSSTRCAVACAYLLFSTGLSSALLVNDRTCHGSWKNWRGSRPRWVSQSLRPCSALCTTPHQSTENQHYEAPLSSPMHVRRRDWLATSAGALSGAFCALRPSHAAPSDGNPLAGLVKEQQQAKSLELASGLLESRVLENVMSPPPYGMEGSDVYYPAWMSGTWNVASTTTEVQAPCGVALFGGNTTLATAQKEIGPDRALHYQSRFVSGEADYVIADREFNVKSIAKVAMGVNSVVDIAISSPNKLRCLLSPTGSPSMLTVDLITSNRRQEAIDGSNFHCSEVVRQIVSPVGDSTAGAASRRAPLLKEMETTSLYTRVSPTEIRCRQRSAAFLVPSQQDPLQFQMWQASQGRPTDVRFYDVVYTKKGESL